jgi:hypothetical protein
MRSIFVFILVLGLSMLLITPAFAQTEDELVAKFLKKAERKQDRKIGYLFVNGSMGRLYQDNDYNKMTNRVSPLISSVSGSNGGMDKIDYSYELAGGFGMMASTKTSVEFQFSYWLKQGSSQTGDFNLSLVNYDDPNDLYSFELNSEIQIYGFSGSLDYYLSEPPNKQGQLQNMALKVGGGIGYYFAKWDIWDGFAGYNLNTSEADVISGQLEGSAPGFMANVAAELPLGLGGMVVEAEARYLYLNFTSMKWYNSSNDEIVATVNNSGAKVELDMSGPRFQFGLKRYFSW